MTKPSVRWVADHPVAAFFALTYLFSWGVWSPLVAGSVSGSLQTTLLITVGGFGPAAAAAVATWAAGDSVRAWAAQILRWGVPARYWAFALGFPAAFVAAASLLDVGLFGGAFDPTPVGRFVGYPLGLLAVFAAGGGNEEPGWRGFALPRLQSRYSALTASLVVGVGWLVWHLPLFTVQGSAQAGLPLQFYAVAVVAESVVFTWLYNQSGGSVLLAMVLHASVNNAPAFYLAGGGAAALTTRGYGLITLVVALTAVAVVVVYGPETLSNGAIPTGPPGADATVATSTAE